MNDVAASCALKPAWPAFMLFWSRRVFFSSVPRSFRSSGRLSLRTNSNATGNDPSFARFDFKAAGLEKDSIAISETWIWECDKRFSFFDRDYDQIQSNITLQQNICRNYLREENWFMHWRSLTYILWDGPTPIEFCSSCKVSKPLDKQYVSIWYHYKALQFFVFDLLAFENIITGVGCLKSPFSGDTTSLPSARWWFEQVFTQIIHNSKLLWEVWRPQMWDTEWKAGSFLSLNQSWDIIYLLSK